MKRKIFRYGGTLVIGHLGLEKPLESYSGSKSYLSPESLREEELGYFTDIWLVNKNTPPILKVF
jgi:hypothetical protein